MNIRRFIYRWFGWAEKRRLAKEADARMKAFQELAQVVGGITEGLDKFSEATKNIADEIIEARKDHE